MTAALADSKLHEGVGLNGANAVPGCDPSELGIIELPNDWHVAPLGELLTASQYGLSVKGGPEGRCPILRMTNQVNGRIKAEKLQYADVTDKQLQSHRVEPGDLLFNRTNSLELVGRTAIFDLPGDYVFASYLIRLRAKADGLDPEFLNFYLGGEQTQKRLKGIATRAVSQSNISATRLQGFPIPLPPLPEQKRIAHILSTVQWAIEAQERIIQTTTELKKALMHQLFTEGTRGEKQKDSEIGPIPVSWEVVELGDVAKIERGKFSHRPRNEPRFYDGKYPFVQTGDVSNCDGRICSYTQTLNEEGLAISKMFPAGTILITIAANIGFTGILEFDSACPDSLIGITPNENVQTEFLNYYLITQQPEMDRLAPKGTQKNINIQFLKPWLIPLPSIEEQTEIAKTFSATDRKIRLATQKRNQLQNLFRSLLHELMTAKTLVNGMIENQKGGGWP
jgi:type I restriction enzyme S subunit